MRLMKRSMSSAESSGLATVTSIVAAPLATELMGQLPEELLVASWSPASSPFSVTSIASCPFAVGVGAVATCSLAVEEGVAPRSRASVRFAKDACGACGCCWLGCSEGPASVALAAWAGGASTPEGAASAPDALGIGDA